MNRFTITAAGTLLAAWMAAGGLMLAGQAGASPAHRSAAAGPAAAVSCKAAHRSYAFPRKPARFGAGTAGAVTVAPVNSGTITVTNVHTAPGYRGYVDSSRGSSVDVYFHGHGRAVKFEAEINDSHGLTVIVTACHR